MRKHFVATLVVFGAVLAARPSPARADVGLGVFIGEPTGLDVKLGLGPRSGLDILLGWNTFRDNRNGYGHVTYLLTPVVGQGSSVLVPVRLGIGGALYGVTEDIGFAVRAPLEIGLRLRRTPIEFYGEVAIAFILFDDDDDLYSDLQGGLGVRFYF